MIYLYIPLVFLGIYLNIIYIVWLFICWIIKLVNPIQKKLNIQCHIKETRTLFLKLQTINNKEGIDQLNRFLKKKEVINLILSNSFNSNEITYIKYTDTLNETYLCFLDNLEKYWLTIKSINTIGNKGAFKSVQGDNWHSEQEKKTLTLRYEVSNNNRIIAKKLLFENEKALLNLGVFLAEIISLNNEGTNKVKLAKKNLLNISKRINNCG